MHNRAFGTFQRFKSALNQVVTCLNQNLDIDIIWNMIFFNQLTGKVKINL
mgnify:CR=1 FL=1